MNIKTTVIDFFYIVIGAFCSLYCFITAFEIPVSPLPFLHFFYAEVTIILDIRKEILFFSFPYFLLE